MQLMFRDLRCDEMYNLTINWITLNQILELLQEYKNFDKNTSNISNSIYVVFADCLGDLMGESSDAFYIDTMPNILFIDPYSPVNQWVLIAHELIHHLQQVLYTFYEGINDELEDMAYELQYKVKNLLCSPKAIQFDYITDEPTVIDDLIQQVKTIGQESQIYAYEGVDGTNYLY